MLEVVFVKAEGRHPSWCGLCGQLGQFVERDSIQSQGKGPPDLVEEVESDGTRTGINLL